MSLWRFKPVDDALAGALSRSLGVHPVVARVMAARGLGEPAAARAFLHPESVEPFPYARLPGLEVACERVLAAVAARRRIAVYGDYDVDGLSATAVMLHGLARLGVQAACYIPNRLDEGYGLNTDALHSLAEDGVECVITVDCGSAAVAEAEFARARGLELIITDHHQPSNPLPVAAAVVNPNLPGAGGPPLAGCGVAYALVSALWQAAGAGSAAELLDLVALGTIADMVPLTGENRRFAALGLASMRTSLRPGLAALARRAGLSGPIAGDDVSFKLGPRLNAAGRMGDARLALDLLLTDDLAAAERLARELDELNERRRTIEQQVAEEALLQAEALDSAAGLVLWGEGWHPGVVGIVAARVVERTGKPAAVLGLRGEWARGSARSVPGFDLHAALGECRELFEAFGGHAQAAGLTLAATHLHELRVRFAEVCAARLEAQAQESLLWIDTELMPESCDLSLAGALQALAPFGPENEPPVFAIQGLELDACQLVGRDLRHLKCRFRVPAGMPLDGIGFGMGPLAEQFGAGRRVDAAFQLEVNVWNNLRRAQLRLIELQPAAADRVQHAVVSGPLVHDLRGAKLEGLASKPAACYVGQSAPAGLPGAWRVLGDEELRRGRPCAEPLIWLDVPLSFETLAELVQSAQGDTVLAFGFARVAEHERRWWAHYPSDPVLRLIYAAIRAAQPGLGESARLAQLVGPRADVPPSPEGIDWACRVLVEAGLITARPDGRLAASPRTSARLDLSISPAYNEGTFTRDQGLALCRLAVDPDPYALLRAARLGPGAGKSAESAPLVVQQLVR